MFSIVDSEGDRIRTRDGNIHSIYSRAPLASRAPPPRLSAFAKYLAAGIAISGLGSVALAIGMIFSSLLISTAKTPWLASILTGQAFLGFALCEAMSLLIILVAVLLIFA